MLFRSHSVLTEFSSKVLIKTQHHSLFRQKPQIFYESVQIIPTAVTISSIFNLGVNSDPISDTDTDLENYLTMSLQ